MRRCEPRRHEIRGVHLLIGLMVVVIALAAVESTSLSCLYTAEEMRSGSRYHQIPCRKWPTMEEAKRIMEERADIVERIEGLPTVDVFLEAGRCEGKAQLIIYFGGLSNIRSRDKAIEIIGDGKMFFGIPYSLVNS